MVEKGLEGFDILDFLPGQPQQKEVTFFLGVKNVEMYNKAVGTGRPAYVSKIAEALLLLFDSDHDGEKANSFCKKSYLLMLHSYSKYHLYYEDLKNYENRLPVAFHVLGCALFFPEYTHQNIGNSMRRRFITAFIAHSNAEGIKGNISYYNRVLNYVEGGNKDNRKELRGWLKDKRVLGTIVELSQNSLVVSVELRSTYDNLKGYVAYKDNLPLVLDRSPSGSMRRRPRYSEWLKISSSCGGWSGESETIFNDIIKKTTPPK